MSKQKLSVEKRAELVRRHRAGEAVPALAKAFAITGRQVYRIVRDETGHAQRKAERQITVAFRAERDELAAFQGAADRAGFATQSQALRALLRMAVGLFDATPARFGAFDRAAWLIGKQGALLNQLARNTHKGKLRLTEADRRLLAELIEANRGLHADLRAIVDEARARKGYLAASLKAAQTDRARAEEVPA